jgi:hypothetical protein
MRLRTVAAASLAAVVAAGTFAPAVAAPKPKPKPKPVSKTYTATAATPDPVGPLANGQNCQPNLPGSFHEEPFTVPFAGTLKVDLAKFQGDWALGVFKGGTALADSDQDVGEPLDRPESVTLKFKRAGDKIVIRACNFAGGPTGEVTYVMSPK